MNQQYNALLKQAIDRIFAKYGPNLGAFFRDIGTHRCQLPPVKHWEYGSVWRCPVCASQFRLVEDTSDHQAAKESLVWMEE